MPDVEGLSQEMCVRVKKLLLSLKVRILSKPMRNWIVEVRYPPDKIQRPLLQFLSFGSCKHMWNVPDWWQKRVLNCFINNKIYLRRYALTFYECKLLDDCTIYNSADTFILKITYSNHSQEIHDIFEKKISFHFPVPVF